MRSILNALQEGRLIELPDNNKDKALQYLANLIEGIPDVASGFDIGEAVSAREKASNTGIGMGWACPHVRAAGEGELISAVGWCPSGIDYGSPDGKPVKLVVMFYIPDSQKNAYLKELSSLARSIQKAKGLNEIADAENLAQVRNQLLDWVSQVLEENLPPSRARMIQLEAKAAQLEARAEAQLKTISRIVPLTAVIVQGAKPMVLAQDADIVPLLEASPIFAGNLAAKSTFEVDGWRILVRSVTPYKANRFVYDCLALSLN